MSRRPAAILGLAACLAGCEGVLPAPDWEQMIDQHKLRPFEASSLFADGRAMRPPPDGTVSRSRIIGPPELTGGRDAAGVYVGRIPLPLSQADLQAGRDSFETWCATCHGMTGDGQSVVARHMELRKPPSLVADPVQKFPVGRIYEVIAEGYGLMPSYRHQLAVGERWAVVGYVRALELGAAARLDDLPADVRAAAERGLAQADRRAP
jgi:mono/diheme cytochrome c family protein